MRVLIYYAIIVHGVSTPKTVLGRMLRVGNHQAKTARHVIFVLIFHPFLKYDSQKE